MILQLKGDVSNEKLFGSFTLYNIRLRRRISETFHFDVNEELGEGKKEVCLSLLHFG